MSRAKLLQLNCRHFIAGAAATAGLAMPFVRVTDKDTGIADLARFAIENGKAVAQKA